MRWLASSNAQYRLLHGVTALLADNSLLRGVPPVVLLAGYWGAHFEPERSRWARRVVLAGFMAAGVALLMARVCQNLWPTPRPIYDPALTALFRPGATIGADYNSFPSDHAAFLLPLVWTVGRLQPWLGFITAVLLAAGLTARVCQGLHFPVDIVGGLGVGALAMAVIGRPGSRVVRRALDSIQGAQTRWPWPTASALFVVAYGYASMFEAFRDFAAAVARALARL